MRVFEESLSLSGLDSHSPRRGRNPPQTPQSSSLLHFKSTFSPWDHVPAHYINCEPDRSIPPEMQRSMAAQKGMWTTNSLKKGHFPSLACPGELAGCVDAFIKEILTDSAILT